MKIAIYSRKSKYTGKGDSIGNQIQMCKDYINRNYPEEEITFFEYEDEGYTGAITNRPKFKKLIADIPKRKYDALICYRLDRISRTVSDFSSTLSFLQSHKTNFISIKEQFDTSTPMGRAMIYIASVFAQLERETIAERVRDNMMELAKNGRWSGGRLPMGYKSEKVSYIDEDGKERSGVKLIPDEDELKVVKLIYETYLKKGSLHKTEVYFTQNNIKSTTGTLLEKTSLKVILQNPIYVKSDEEVIEYLNNNSWNVYGEPDGKSGLLSYNKTKSIIKDGKYVKVNKEKGEWIAAVSNCPGIIDSNEWIKVQEQFKENKDKFPRLGKTNNALLTGKIRCGECGSYMRVVHGRVSKETGKKFFYYTCAMKTKSKGELCKSKNIKSDQLEETVLTSLEMLGKNKKEFLDRVRKSKDINSINKKRKLKIDNIQKEINDKNKVINGLLDKLALSDDISDIILERIKKLKDEVKTLEVELNKIKDIIMYDKSEKVSVDIVSELLDKCADIKSYPPEQQKSIIDLLVDSITYDSYTQQVNVNIIGCNEESKKKLTFNY